MLHINDFRCISDLTVFDDMASDKMGPPLHLFEYLGDIFADYAYRQKIYRTEENNG